MADEKPEQAVVDRIKAQFPNRLVKRVSMTHDDEEMSFVLTSPVRDEWRKYRREITEAGGDIEKVEDAIERGALAQIRWPEREVVRAIFDRKPGMIQNFAEKLSELSGSHVEVSTKKL